MPSLTPNLRVAIAGGGPAGMMLGFLLARAGIEVAVLEKYPDFFRDFRGDTIHPSTMEVLHELGLLEDFLKLKHNDVRQMNATIGNQSVTIADFSRLKVHCPFIAFIPQWDFLNFIADHAAQYPTFHLMKETEVTDLIQENGAIAGLTAKTPTAHIDLRADLTIGADGRHSTVREKSGLKVQNIGAPMDVLWFRLSRIPGDPEQALGRIDYGKMMIMLDRNDYWQCGFIIRKGDFDTIKSQGLQSFHDSIRLLAPFLNNRPTEITSWDQVKLLTVTVDRLPTWHRPGLLCIGDAAHAMSPIGGVGINLAIQDAVASANILIPKLKAGPINESILAEIQSRREWPVKMTQRFQVIIQNRVIRRVLNDTTRPKLPWPLKLIRRFPTLRRIPARIIGIGFRPEHIRH
jgi:2-polyprenyl-6-methoxyphenol hydroxylase-like FAD-dependent oxidoreductase